ncbi:DUF4301 family protein [Flavobacterium arcticum]|uniref:DUF4301 family protein n=1 Tax=Flavobacterium arcticum TaxID=1784713 RepID=A0A345HC11_9FLAO|nr:DUF4301 family protein [Flavobacterium arcticum]AXG74121.1 DUF4301 family protein [Flavobacterium arcticum]KAF2507319.1 DUF4301 family protein [Flavobacterium arcticum]
MEKNITKPNTSIVNIIIYAPTSTTASLVSEAIESEENLGNMAITRVLDIEKAMSKKNKFADHKIIVIATPVIEDDKTKELIALLDRNNSNYITIIADGDMLALNAKKAINDLKKAISLGFTIKDYTDIYNRGISIEKIENQINTFINGINKITLKKPAVINDGIFKLPKKSAEDYAAYFESKKDNFKLTKFVPASGAATRMFKFLNEFMVCFNPEEDTINAYINRKKDTALNTFLVGLDKFPFFNAIVDVVKENPNYNDWSKSTRAYNFIKTMLQDERFDFANKPKGILPFHQYDGFIATPVCEHLKESVAYSESQKKSNVHFTISEEHLDGFLDAITTSKNAVEKESGTSIDFSFSYQHKKTDTLAVDMNNVPFREDNGAILFRPGGHGALIENLNNLEADIVFVKNIDNVSHNNIETISLYKKALAGSLIELQEQLFIYLHRIDEGNVSEEEEVKEIFEFAKKQLSQHIPADVSKFTHENRVEYARQLLNRPIRVCGMVKNEGEPGGGPFWVEEEKGKLSLQIVESSQIDMKNANQKLILSQSTHFNPVDLVCGLKNYKGEYFNLNEYVDENTGFIVTKNRLGKDVKSYELPGLWNGAMAGWITVFAEVPLDTFSPVKTVNDLLKPAHQPQ